MYKEGKRREHDRWRAWGRLREREEDVINEGNKEEGKTKWKRKMDMEGKRKHDRRMA